MDNGELDKQIELLKNCEYIKDINYVKQLCEKAKEILSQQENIIYLNAPITVSTFYHNIFNILFRFVATFMVNFMI